MLYCSLSFFIYRLPKHLALSGSSVIAVFLAMFFAVNNLAIAQTIEQATEQATEQDNPFLASINKPLTPIHYKAKIWAQGQTSRLVSAAPVSGSYALVEQKSGNIEIRDIREKLLHKIKPSHLAQALSVKDINLDHSAIRICAITLTPSARILFIGVCGQQGAKDKINSDAILAFNLNTNRLSVFSQLVLSTTKTPSKNLSMAFFKGELFIGTDKGLYRFDASRNTVAEGKADKPINMYALPKNTGVTGLAINLVNQTLYVSNQQALYRLSLKRSGAKLTLVTEQKNIYALTYAQSFGQHSNQGLYALSRDNKQVNLLFVNNENLLDNKHFQQLAQFPSSPTSIKDLSATADGKLFLAAENTVMIEDQNDAFLSFDGWLIDELQQYVSAIKSLIGSKNYQGSNAIIPEGFLARKIVAQGNKQNLDPIADNVGWALFLLMAADQASPDKDIEPLIELLIKRHAGLHPDGLGGVKTVDGHFVRNYEPSGIPHKKNPQAQVYISMKFFPAVYKAAELYPDNVNITLYKEYLRQIQKRASDTMNAKQRITWTNDDHGPILTNNRMTNETWLYGDIGAAQDPLATQDYGHYVYQRQNMNYDEWLLGEPVIKASHSVFIIMGGTMILKHHFDDPAWREQNKNYYAITMAAGDDLGAPYFSGFSAGHNPFTKGSSYYNDGPSDHPGDIIHFPAVLGLGQLGWTSPVVGGYQAYRAGLRQKMLNGATGENIEMLTRWSLQKPSYKMNSLGIADFWYGAMGLIETIKPGTIAKLRNEFYLPALKQEPLANNTLALHFSKISPRRIIATTHNGEQVSFGFQLSPFIIKQPELYAHYQAVDPEGEFLELNKLFTKQPSFSNPNFEQGLAGWQQKGDKIFAVASSENNRIVGKSLVVSTQKSEQLANNSQQTFSVSQSLSLATDLKNTRYLIRANGLSSPDNTKNSAYMQVAWDNDNNADNGILKQMSSQQLAPNTQIAELMIDTLKPAKAHYLHISFVVTNSKNDSQTNTETGTETDSFVFDNLSVVRLGAAANIANGNFENGFKGWNKSSKSIRLIEKEAYVLEGKKSALFVTAPKQNMWHNLVRSFNVEQDPKGSRYIFKLKAKAIRMLDSDFEILMEVYNSDGKKVIVRNDIGDILPSTNGEIAFTFRKRPTDAKYKLILRMKRNGNLSKSNDLVIIDDLSLTKEKLF